jgi:beta-glucanase (GH16 family)
MQQLGQTSLRSLTLACLVLAGCKASSDKPVHDAGMDKPAEDAGSQAGDGDAQPSQDAGGNAEHDAGHALPDNPDIPGYKLVWRDEFDVPGLPDESKWGFEVHKPGWVNMELQNYTDRRMENARVEDGKLIIEARHDGFDGEEYSSARINTDGKADFTYVRVLARARVPSAKGTWPAFWMMPSDPYRYASNCSADTGWTPDCDAWPASGEIDIMEHVGYDPNVVHATVHCRAYNWSNGTQKTSTVNVPGAVDGFHDYMLERTSDALEFFVDGQSYFRYENDGTGADTWPFDAPFYVILNLAVGGVWGGKEGVDADAYPARFEVEFVRVYEKLP